MAIDDIDDFSSVSSSIFYAKRNTLEKQGLLLNLASIERHDSSKQTELPALGSPSERSSIGNSHLDVEIEESPSSWKKKIIYKPQPLSTYYSEIPVIKKEKKPIKKINKRKRGKKTSPTRQLLTSALLETKERLLTHEKSYLKKKTLSRQEKKKRDLWKRKKQTIELNHFISEINVRTKEIQAEALMKPDVYQIQQESTLKENDPFPFTNLTEWLIWHNNYPELAFVREAYDLEQIPEEGDVEIFWVNVMNDPEFFNPDWRIAGSTIDLDSIKYQRKSDWKPEWDIMATYTDGFSTFFKDIHQILTQNPQGLNYRYSILQFALKGLLLLDLAYFDAEKQKWFSKGSFEDLMIRLKELDQFVSQQENVSTYQQNLTPSMVKNNWYSGLICFDLLITQSIYLKHFSQNQLTEDEKIHVINQANFRQTILKKLSTLEEMDTTRVRSLQRKLQAS
ncbi:MAG: hypothetical protein ACFFB5_10990 [Promethearchaeota archaeon]